MQPPGTDKKYRWEDGPLDDAALLDHLRGRITFAAPLIGPDGMTRAFAIDADHGGELAGLQLLDSAAIAGVSAVFITSTNEEHDGGWLWGFFRNGVQPEAARALGQTIVRLAGLPHTTEIWPCGKAARLPFGVHTWTSRRGVLILQDSRRFDLDTPADLIAGIEAWLALPRNVTPPSPAPEPAPVRAPFTPKSIDGRTGKDVIDAFIRDTDLVDLLVNYGARVQKPTAGGTLLHCHCPGHAHKDKQASIEVLRDRSGRQAVVGSAPNCIYYFGQGKRFDAFNVYCMHEGLTPKEAIKKFAPPRLVPSQRIPLSDVSTSATLSLEDQAVRRRDAERKRVARQQDAATTLVKVRERLAADTNLPVRARKVAEGLLAVAEHGIDGTQQGFRDWCRPSTQRLAQMTGQTLRTTERGLADLEEYGYIQSGERNGRTTIRTFLRPPLGATPTPASGAAAHDGQIPDQLEIRTILCPPLSLSSPPTVADVSLTCNDLIPSGDRACERGGNPPAPKISAMRADEGEAEWANYDPAGDWTGHVASTPSVRNWTLDLTPKDVFTYQRRPGDLGAWSMCDDASTLAEADQLDVGDLTTLGQDRGAIQINQPRLRQQPPSDPVLRKHYYALLGKAKQCAAAGNDRQARALRLKATELLEIVVEEEVTGPPAASILVQIELTLDDATMVGHSLAFESNVGIE